MGRNDFNRNKCIKALNKLGFICKNKRRGNHDKFVPPKHLLENAQPGQPPFIMVPRSRKLHCQLEILKELWALGGDDLVKKFLEYI
ncbi:hypothetical protein KAU19_07695 [Candidatus Parcubacteria bacterium]|nr:hypothetical protein [Candidatus Parcubacteria bacterium]